MFLDSSKHKHEHRSLDQRIRDCRRQVVSAIEPNEINDKSTAKLLAGLADECNARVLLAPQPPGVPTIFTGDLPIRPKLRGMLVRLISGAF